jgi:uncharacterized protein
MNAPTTDPSSSARSQRRTAALWTWLGNVVLGSGVGLAYLEGQRVDTTLRLWVFAHLGLVSSIATLALVPLAVCWLVSRAGVRERGFAIAQSVIWMLFQVALVVDTQVYGLFRYHLNGAAWNLLTTRGSEDSYRLGPKIWLFGFALAAAFYALEWSAWLVLTSPAKRASLRATLIKSAWAGAALVVLSIGIEKSIYAQADIAQDRSIAAVSRAFPMYPRISVVPMLPEPLKDEIDALPEVPVTYDGARLAYPREEPRVAPDGPRPNVLIVVIDSWRRDMLDPEVTPSLARFAERSRRFDDHVSGGNGTRFGVFSMIYGLHGSYWWPVLEARRRPVLLEQLERLGYEMRVYSSASMDFPEFRQTAWIGLEDAVYDDFGELRQSERDALVIEHASSWLKSRPGDRPYFAFLLLDSAHQRYDFPDEHAVFRPYAADIDYLEMAGSRDPELVERVRNRYRNALRHADALTGRLLDELAASGGLEDTLVVVTGDHGEEFADNGSWGHTGNFTDAQVAVPFVVRGPGIAPGVETRPTSHVDLAPTLLELLGADPRQRSRWCNGSSLLEPPERRARVVGGWEEIGLLTPSGIFRVPRASERGLVTTVCDSRWELVSDQRTAFTAERDALRSLVEECARFLVLPETIVAR